MKGRASPLSCRKQSHCFSRRQCLARKSSVQILNRIVWRRLGGTIHLALHAPFLHLPSPRLVGESRAGPFHCRQAELADAAKRASGISAAPISKLAQAARRRGAIDSWFIRKKSQVLKKGKTHWH